MSNKYSWFQNHEETLSFTVVHKENDVETIIAITEDAEKAHFIATACNAYTEPKDAEHQIKDWKVKAEKWDALDKKIEAFYFDKDGNELPEDEQYNLDGIGEAAASAFGYM